MQNLLTILSQTTAKQTPAAEAISASFWDPASVALCTVGCCILVIWLFWFDGFGALRKAPPRRHHWWLPAFGLLILILWVFLMALIQVTITSVFGSKSSSTQEIITYPPNAVLELGLIAAMLITAHRMFARRLTGFGLSVKDITRQAGLAIVNLLAVFPLILIGLWITLAAGRIFKGADFELQVHESLSILSDTSPGMQILVIIFAVLIVPIFEELLFRGFFQTSLRTLSGKPWVGIVLTSSLFAILHPLTHILALFMLSCGLGYAYERNGSLLRPILMHIFFNGLSVGMTLLIPR